MKVIEFVKVLRAYQIDVLLLELLKRLLGALIKKLIRQRRKIRKTIEDLKVQRANRLSKNQADEALGN